MCVYESWLEILDLSDSDLEVRKHTFKLTLLFNKQSVHLFSTFLLVNYQFFNPSLTKICFTVASHTDTFWPIIQSLLPNKHWEAKIA